MRFSYLICPVAIAMLGACSSGGDAGVTAVPSAAVVATAAPDYSSGAVSLVKTTAPYTAQNKLNGTISDISIRASGDHYFLIKRYGTDQIQRYESSTPTTPTWTYLTNSSSSEDSNPYDIVTLSATKAYLIRYGSAAVWIVNPSATTEAAFKTGEISLAQYDADGIPEMSAGLIKDGKLYIAMQRLQNYAATQSGYVAVIDTTTDQEIAAGPSGAALKGVPLPVSDPFRLMSVPGSSAVIVAADGGYDGNFNPQYNGGIVSIDPSRSYATTLLVDDGNADTHVYGTISDVAMAANDRGYFVGSKGSSGTQSLYRFNPNSAGTPVAVSNYQMASLGPISVDPLGNLWVGLESSSAPGLGIVGFVGGTETVVNARIDTVLNPLNIDFLTASPNF